jgi:hypothetical protein
MIFNFVCFNGIWPYKLKYLSSQQEQTYFSHIMIHVSNRITEEKWVLIPCSFHSNIQLMVSNNLVVFMNIYSVVWKGIDTPGLHFYSKQ